MTFLLALLRDLGAFIILYDKPVKNVCITIYSMRVIFECMCNEYYDCIEENRFIN